MVIYSWYKNQQKNHPKQQQIQEAFQGLRPFCTFPRFRISFRDLEVPDLELLLTRRVHGTGIFTYILFDSYGTCRQIYMDPKGQVLRTNWIRGFVILWVLSITITTEGS